MEINQYFYTMFDENLGQFLQHPVKFFQLTFDFPDSDKLIPNNKSNR